MRTPDPAPCARVDCSVCLSHSRRQVPTMVAWPLPRPISPPSPRPPAAVFKGCAAAALPPLGLTHRHTRDTADPPCQVHTRWSADANGSAVSACSGGVHTKHRPPPTAHRAATARMPCVGHLLPGTRVRGRAGSPKRPRATSGLGREGAGRALSLDPWPRWGWLSQQDPDGRVLGVAGARPGSSG